MKQYASSAGDGKCLPPLPRKVKAVWVLAHVCPGAPALPCPTCTPVSPPACSVADSFLHLLTVVQFSASRPGFLTFWDQCTEGLSPFICPVERVLLTFCNQYSARLSLRQPGLAEAGEWAAGLPPLPSFLRSPVMGP